MVCFEFLCDLLNFVICNDILTCDLFLFCCFCWFFNYDTVLLTEVFLHDNNIIGKYIQTRSLCKPTNIIWIPLPVFQSSHPQNQHIFPFIPPMSTWKLQYHHPLYSASCIWQRWNDWFTHFPKEPGGVLFVFSYQPHIILFVVSLSPTVGLAIVLLLKGLSAWDSCVHLVWDSFWWAVRTIVFSWF